MDNTGVPADQPPHDQPAPAGPPAGPTPPWAPPPGGPAQPWAGQPQPWPGQPQPWAGQPQPWAAGPAQPFVAPPPPNWGPPPAPRATSRWLVPAIILCGLMVLGCLSAIGYGVMQAGERTVRADGRSSSDRSGLFPSATPDDTGTEPAGPEASTYPVREEKDLERVCDNVYYPQSPKYTGAAPHQISVGVVESKDFASRHFRSYMDVPYSLPEKVRNAWRPKDLGKSQLMACVDLVTTGAQVRKCTFDDPKPEQIVMKRGTYRLRLFEVATGRKLLEKQLPGSNKECPTMVLLGDDRIIYTEVADRDLYELLRSYVMKK